MEIHILSMKVKVMSVISRHRIALSASILATPSHDQVAMC